MKPRQFLEKINKFDNSLVADKKKKEDIKNQK